MFFYQIIQRAVTADLDLKYLSDFKISANTHTVMYTIFLTNHVTFSMKQWIQYFENYVRALLNAKYGIGPMKSLFINHIISFIVC